MQHDDREREGAESAVAEASFQASAGGRRHGDAPLAGASLDAAELAPTGAVVEERISPGETNVFDK